MNNYIADLEYKLQRFCEQEVQVRKLVGIAEQHTKQKMQEEQLALNVLKQRKKEHKHAVELKRTIHRQHCALKQDITEIQEEIIEICGRFN